MYKALRNGVQEVAVKVLLCTDEDQLNAFQKVLPASCHWAITLSKCCRAVCEWLAQPLVTQRRAGHSAASGAISEAGALLQ